MPAPQLAPEDRAARRSPTIEESIDHLARWRQGLVPIEALRADGVSDARRRRALRRGGLVEVRRGVYRPDGVTIDATSRLLAVCLSIGPHAVASHRSALWLWNLIEDPGLIEVSVSAGHKSVLDGTIVHRSTDLKNRYRWVRRGVPATTPARSLLDGGAVLPPDALARAVEQALIDRLVTVAGLRTILHELAGRGRRGAGALRRYLDARALADARAESQLEPLMARLCRDHGVGPVLFQSSVVLGGSRYRPDFQIPDVRLVVEVDGLDAHRTRDALDDDLTRQNAFIRHGWLVLRYTSTHLRRPAKVAREVIDTARQRRSELVAGQ